MSYKYQCILFENALIKQNSCYILDMMSQIFINNELMHFPSEYNRIRYKIHCEGNALKMGQYIIHFNYSTAIVFF